MCVLFVFEKETELLRVVMRTAIRGNSRPIFYAKSDSAVPKLGQYMTTRSPTGYLLQFHNVLE